MVDVFQMSLGGTEYQTIALQYVSHVIRLPESGPAKVALNWTPQGGKRMSLKRKPTDQKL